MQKILDVKAVSLTIKLKILMLIVKKIRSFTLKDHTFYPKRSDLLHTPLPSFQIYLKLYNHHLLYFKLLLRHRLTIHKIPTDENQRNPSFSSVEIQYLNNYRIIMINSNLHKYSEYSLSHTINPY